MKLLDRISDRLPTWALPFVTRSLRGGRSKRFAALSVVLALMTLVVGPYLALNDGELAHEVRVSVGFEDHTWARERSEHVVIVHDDWSQSASQSALARAEALRARHPVEFENALMTGSQPDAEWNPIMASGASAWTSAVNAAITPVESRRHLALQARAARAVNLPVPDNRVSGEPNWENGSEFPWWDDSEVKRLESVLDNGWLPKIERYHSTLGVSDVFRMIGGVASVLLMLALFFVAPVVAAVQQAQEAHENTLMPLIGTALSPRQLTRGLLAGAVAAPAIVVLPLVGIVLAAGLLVGAWVPAMLLVVTLVAGGFFGCAIGQLVGQFMGKRRTPGAVAVAFVALTGIAWMSGLGIGFETHDEAAHALALAPQSAGAWLIAQAFGTGTGFVGDAASSSAHLLIQAAGAIVLATLGVRAVARRIALLEGPTLTRSEAFVGVVATSAMVCLAGSEVLRGGLDVQSRVAFYYATLAPLLPTFLIFAMSRVPVRDAPTSMLVVPLRRVMAEVFGASAVHLLFASLFAGPAALVAIAGDPVALMYWLWAWSVLALLAIRLAVLPTRGVVRQALVVVCVIGVAVAIANSFGLAMGLTNEPLMMADGGNVLGAMQVVGIFAIPAALVHSLVTRLQSL